MKRRSTKRRQRSAPAAHLMAWFTSVWGEDGGCGIARRYRVFLKDCVRKRMTCAQVWVATDIEGRNRFRALTNGQGRNRFRAADAYAFENLIYTVEEALSERRHLQRKTVAVLKAELRTLKRKQAGPTLLDIQRVRGRWVPRWRAS